MPDSSQMAREIAEMPDAVARLAGIGCREISQNIAGQLRALDPPALLTVARGSSDHAATYLSYATQMVLGIPVASVGPSISSVHQRSLKVRGLPVVAISQSGTSTDIVSVCGSFSSQGGSVVALTNSIKSPLAAAAGSVIDIHAGPEHAIAATKSCLNSIVAGLWLLADWAEDASLLTALEKLPDAMTDVAQLAVPSDVSDALGGASKVVILGRGAGLGLAKEVALKLIETCGIQAVAYSSAEVLHGPNAMLTGGYPVLALETGTKGAMHETLDRLRGQRARVVVLSEKQQTGHLLVDPLLDLQPIYRIVEGMARARGFNPDRPRHLQKETNTT